MPEVTMTRTQRALDRLAIGTSGLCLLHCLALPVLLLLVPVWAGRWLADESFHRLLLLGVIPLSSVALWLGCRRHRDRGVLVLGSLGLAMLAVGVFWGHELAGEYGELALTVSGSLTVVAGHWRNFRQCRDDSCET